MSDRPKCIFSVYQLIHIIINNTWSTAHDFHILSCATTNMY